MNALRRRIPFRVSEDEPQDTHILDEQEQEGVIDLLREESASSNAFYLVSLQAVVVLSLLLHVLYVTRFPKPSPIAILFQDTTVGPPVPLATAMAWLQIAIHCNLGMNLLHTDHPLRSALQIDALRPSLRLPLPLSHPATVLSPVLAPTYALLLGQDWIDVLWWSTAGLLTLLITVILRWIKEEEEEITELEKLRYTARGA
ncbi:hypothetical protein BD414DRAFT_428225 [Trametes punicea]|nr:hypothetical protein BD414DRAFT_428225 [Trametes punicea]